jgi:hypothetical protein
MTILLRAAFYFGADSRLFSLELLHQPDVASALVPEEGGL